MFSWGENIPNGFGLVKPNSLENNSDTGVSFTPTIQALTPRQVSANNRVVAFTRNDGKAYFFRQQEGKDGEVITGKPKRIDCKAQVQAVHCGDAGLLLLSMDCIAYFVNFNGPTVPRTLLSGGRVMQVACGDQHYIALTQGGLVYTWGKNSSGQLGLGIRESSIIVSSPQPLKTLSGIPLAQITAGGNHSFALSLSGTVFGWGQNSAGQLGLGDKTDRHTPVPVDCLRLKKTVAISCGERHTAILTKGGLVFTFGGGCYGQLGHNSLRDEPRPRLVAELWGAKVTQIACGRHHTLAFVGSTNKIYSFGHGEKGQLGNGIRTDQSVPLPVQLSQDGEGDKHIWQISAGGNHSFALCSVAQESEKEVNRPIATVKMMKLDEDKVEMWLSKCQNPKSWKKIQTDIQEVFSSPSCLNGSFLDRSLDKHFQTSPTCSGLDLSLARIAFEKLATKDKVLTKIEVVVRDSLLPSLSTAPIGVEDLRVYLILPELLRVLVKLNRGTELTVAVAAAILSLHPASLQVLESLWCRMPYFFFRSAVKTFCNVSTKYIEQTNMETFNSKPLMKTLGVLQKLYFVNSKSSRRLLDKVFHIKVECFFQSLRDLDNQCQTLQMTAGLWWDFQACEKAEMLIWDAKQLYEDRLSFMMAYPCIFNTETKDELWMLELNKTKVSYSLGFFDNTLLVGRETLLHDTFHCLRMKSCDLKEPVKVKFKEEDGEDFRGVSKAFFHLLAKELKSEPQILAVNEDGLAWFTQDDDNVTDEFYLLGVLCGMALYNRCLLDVFFPLALFKKLLGLEPSMDDLKEMSPTEAKGLLELLKYEEEVVEELELDFNWSRGRELLPNGKMIPVTKVNRQKYVDLYVDMVFNKSVQRQFEEFEKGFLEGCPSHAWKIFLPDELMTLLHGDEDFKWEELGENAQYNGYLSTDEVIQNFWDVFREFSEEQKKSFLIFLTGTARLARGCLSRIRVTINVLTTPNPDEHFPEAETCFEALRLPKYSSIQILRQQLLHAINHCDVFGIR
ncbi:putative E3 ubiquitin-protein ligase HERC3 [Polymixia lowei]